MKYIIQTKVIHLREVTLEQLDDNLNCALEDIKRGCGIDKDMYFKCLTIDKTNLYYIQGMYICEVICTIHYLKEAKYGEENISYMF